ncbi:putative non-specific serine/threonine protein kinase [Helianthus annuus]|uniref:Non-specific serine/threonine protein kinase n=1 Tax=Helianthus annuus TaxID=4232 RepID=A0A9K3P2B6_HELAN|nr:putative non-specific serine/threonine protein kinase [Helianthus annuus]KAJ0619867.1 putative non-specific serine/threonine protein kinase [Helianthus annuus]KAJ0787301.1 putative non-specific serine/threonine protein kinase [Helianthus annuus]KAJ0952971.1 putative non-specific serine/threonine protein kinase [Helianthus annuus]
MNLVLFILFVVGFGWLKTTTSTSFNHQPVEGGGEASSGKCLDEERRALLYFKAYINQIHNDPLPTWTTKEEKATNDCCKWQGVTCNEQTGHVTSLDLNYMVIKGKISPSLLNLSYLERLDISHNSFHGAIPMFIGSLTKLRYLDLSNNSFYGTIPRSIGTLSELRHLDLSKNFLLNGTIPPEIRNLTNLKVLSLRSLNNCTVENLDWLYHMSQLEELEMDGISLGKADNWVNVILSLQKLSFLSLDECDLSMAMHPYSNSSANYSSSSIVSLGLGNNNLNSSMFHWLFPLTTNRLEILDLSRNKLHGIPKYLGNLCSLTAFYFENNIVPIKLSDFLNNLSGCTSITLQELSALRSQFTGSLPDDIQKFSSLGLLTLSDNKLNGTISHKVWLLPNLEILDVSSNSLSDFLKLLQVRASFPKMDSNTKKSYSSSHCQTGISDTIPVEFWNMWPSQLKYLNLSSNNITGKVTDLLSNFDSGPTIIDLSSNNFYGVILNVFSSLSWLDLSNNKFHGGISFLCQIVDGTLSFLDLSYNSFRGQIPDCLWHFKNLKVLNLQHNNLYGSLPTSIKYLINTEVLNLSNTKFSGELPLFLRECTKVTILQLGSNKFSGHMPIWIGEKLSRLYTLILKSNNFSGTIPVQLCQLINLQILDLSINNLYGAIPSCLNKLSMMIQDGHSRDQNVHYFNWFTTFSDQPKYVDHASIVWQGSVREFYSTLDMVKSIDLSNNNLTGQIPYELTLLYGLIALNLSNNALVGEIPLKIGQMKDLLHLDLSRNHLSGHLPSSMS